MRRVSDRAMQSHSIVALDVPQKTVRLRDAEGHSVRSSAASYNSSGTLVDPIHGPSGHVGGRDSA